MEGFFVGKLLATHSSREQNATLGHRSTNPLLSYQTWRGLPACLLKNDLAFAVRSS
jgi:hypothetical protein